MLGRRLPSILPPLEPREALEVMRIHSVAGVLPPERPLITRRPFRAPHHSASTAAIVGGGSGPRPGEASLAHHGVLLLDELPEFQRPALEALRQPLEDGVVSVARVQGQALFPARFQLVATMNLCPCAGRGDPAAECTCSAQRLAAFRNKLSSALLDRFDLVVTVPRPRAEQLAAGPSEPSAPVRERVVAGRARLSGPLLRRTKEADELLSRAVERLPLSGRGRARVARVARTAAALAGRRVRCGRSTSPRRSPTARRRSSPHEQSSRWPRSRPPATRTSWGSRAAPASPPSRPRSTLVRSSSACTRSASASSRRSDPAFPPLLRAIHDPPPGLFLRGKAEAALLARPAVAIVGARACSAYGRQIARSVARELASAGLVVVSGLARGVDAEAHRGALEAGGITVAVLGCGIDRDYPAANRELARQVAASGLVVSEYAPGVEPAPWRFPARNRIVAGLCSASVVVEARERSGALITADFALEEGREVFAVPGEITSALSAGSNALLRLGATPLTCAQDVLESFGLVAADRVGAGGRCGWRAGARKRCARPRLEPTSSCGPPASPPKSSPSR